jgi:Presenilin
MTDRYGSLNEPQDGSGEPLAAEDTYILQSGQNGNRTERDGILRQASSATDAEDDEDYDMTIQELLYSSSSYYAIAKPVTVTMVLAALAVVFINTDATIEQGQQAMAKAYHVWNVSDSGASALIVSLGNALALVSFICLMTFGVVLLYQYRSVGGLLSICLPLVRFLLFLSNHFY